MGEKRQVYDSTVVSIQHISEETSSPDASVASAAPVPAPTTSPIHLLQVESPRHSLDENYPPVEVVSGRHGSGVVNVNDGSITVRRQSKPDNHPSVVAEGSYIASAAAYVQERINRRSSSREEVVRRVTEDPLDKTIEPVSQRLTQPKAAPLQLITPRVKELSIPCSKPVPHHPEPLLGISHVEVSEGCKETRLEANNAEEREEDIPQAQKRPSEAEGRLPDLVVINEETNANSHSSWSFHHSSRPCLPIQSRSIQSLSWKTLCSSWTNLPCSRTYCLDPTRRQVLYVVSEAVGISESSYSPVPNAVPTSFFSLASTYPTLSPPTTQLNGFTHQSVQSLAQSSDKLDWPFPSRRYPCDVVNQPFNLSAFAYSPNLEVEPTPPIPKLVGCLVNVSSRCESKELSWQTRRKPPDSVVTTGRSNTYIVNINVNLSVYKHSHFQKVANELPIHPPKTLSKPHNIVISLRRRDHLAVNKINVLGKTRVYNMFSLLRVTARFFGSLGIGWGEPLGIQMHTHTHTL
ncbi:hypothetical protein F5887DRAFT_922231 [Amanita rubescens]|nr:hypothetical protein F5887DRAFT_922231 [Amanita rubescens]